VETLKEKFKMINDYEKDTKLEEVENRLENEQTLSDIIENEEDKKFLEPVKEVVEKPAKKPGKMLIGKVSVEKTRLKKEPEEYSDVRRLLKKGDIVVIDRNKEFDEYYLVTAYGSVGYVSKDAIIIN
jgi:hypothetical protein